MKDVSHETVQKLVDQVQRMNLKIGELEKVTRMQVEIDRKKGNASEEGDELIEWVGSKKESWLQQNVATFHL